MADKSKKTIYTTASGEAFLGADLIAFLQRNDKLFTSTFIGTPADCAGHSNAPTSLNIEQIEAAMQQAGLVAYRTSVPRMCMEVAQNDTHVSARLTGDGSKADVIVIAQRQQTGADMFRFFAGLPDDAPLVGVTGSAKDWRAFGLFHEKAHADNGHSRNASKIERGRAEIEADTGAELLYQQAHSEGVVQDAGVPSQLRAARVIRSFVATGVTNHDMSGLRGVTQAALRDPGYGGDLKIDSAKRALAVAQAEVFIEAIRIKDPVKYSLMLAETFLHTAASTKSLPEEFINNMGQSLVAARGGDPEELAYVQDFALRMHANRMDDSPAARGRLQELAISEIRQEQKNGKHKYTPYILSAAEAVLAGKTLDGVEGARAIVQEFITTAQTFAPAVFIQARPTSLVTPTTSTAAESDRVSVNLPQLDGALAEAETARVSHNQRTAPKLT